MFTSLLLGAALAAPGAPIPKDADPAPTGPAPWVFYLKPDDAGHIQILVYKNQKVTQNRQVTETVDGKAVTKIVQETVDRILPNYVQLDATNPKFVTVGGTTLTLETVIKRAKEGLVVLVSADGKPVEKSWLRTVDPETLIVSAEGLASQSAPRATVAVPTAAPRLVLLGLDKDGRVQIAYNPSTGNNNFNGNMQFARGGGRVVFMNNGAGVQQLFMDDDGNYVQNPVSAEAPIKSLEDIKFDAYDLNGKTVAKDAAMKRLKAGGFVLIAGDGRIPDASYLKLFRGDLLVLVSSELLNVPTGIKGKGAAAGVIVAPAALPVQAIQLKVAVVRPAVFAVPLKVQPLQEAPVAPAPKPTEKK